ncbi:MAG: M48 family metallopeptidase [Paracoccaceae bacterium]
MSPPRPARFRLSPALALLAALALQACVAVAPPPAAPVPPPALVAPDPARAAAAAFVAVVDRVEPVAESYCRSRRAGPLNCDITIAVDDRIGLAPNAYQTVDGRGRPYVIFTLSLIALARNSDELAFVMGHEAAHHIAGHIPRRQDQAMSGAILAGVLAQTAGLPPDEIRAAQAAGAEAGARSYSREFELEADALGTEIALAAGFDPIRGAAFFDRLPDPGDSFLSTHPRNSARKALIAQTVARLRG